MVTNNIQLKYLNTTSTISVTFRNWDNSEQEELSNQEFRISQATSRSEDMNILIQDLYFSGDVRENAVPRNFAIKAIRPNPFNSSSEISYSLDKPTQVKIHVWDITGRLIETLVDRFSDAGNYRVVFMRTDIPSGNYIVELSDGERSLTKEMVLMK